MRQNFGIMEKPSSPDEEISPDSIDPNLIRYGRSWKDVRDFVVGHLKDYPPEVIERELKKEAALFLRKPSKIELLSRQAVRDDLRETRPELRKRVLENWIKNWA